MAKYDYIECGFRFHVIDSDYDYMYARARCANTEANWERALQYQADNEQDFTYDERDCSGSVEVRIELRRTKSYIFIEYRWNKDV